MLLRAGDDQTVASADSKGIAGVHESQLGQDAEGWRALADTPVVTDLLNVVPSIVV